MSRRRKHIDPSGHVERPGVVPVMVGCAKCDETRLKDKPWKAPCAAAEKKAKAA